MAPDSSTLAWKIPWMEEGSHRVRYDWSNLAAAAAECMHIWRKRSCIWSNLLDSFSIIYIVMLQQYMNSEVPDVQAGFRKGRGTRDQIASICWIIKKSKRVPEKHLFLLYWLCQTFDCVDHNNLWKILKEMGIPDHLTYLLRKLYAGQEATVRTGHGTTDWFQIGKGVCQGCML